MRKVYAFLKIIVIVLLLTACSKQQVADEGRFEVSTTASTAVLTPYSAVECIGKDQGHLESDFNAAGFENVTITKIEDLKSSEADRIGTVIAVSIGGQTDFAQGQEFNRNEEVNISCHAFQKCKVTMHIDFIPNLIFSKYDVNLNMNDIFQGALTHGEDKDFEFVIEPGKYTFVFEEAGSSSVNGSIDLNVKGDMNISLEISCHNDKIDVQTIFIEDMGALGENEAMISADCIDFEDKNFEDYSKAFQAAGFTNITFEPIYDIISNNIGVGEIENVTVDGTSDFSRGDIFENDVAIVISYHANEADDPVKKAQAAAEAALEAVIPKEMARRTVIVAMTNFRSLDVFTDDGKAFDSTKFHSYSESDINDNSFIVNETDGTWSALDDSTWHVDSMVLRSADYGTYLKITCNIKTEENNYIVFNVDLTTATTKDYLNGDDPNKCIIEHMEPSKGNSFLTVAEALISEDRDTLVVQNKILAAQNKINAEKEHQSWIDNQFSVWDGRHKELSKLIKENLNDSSSFEPAQADYIDVYDDNMMAVVNQMLEDAGISERVEIGDLFVIQEFTAKNVFNATVKCTAYGIVRGKNDKVILIGID